MVLVVDIGNTNIVLGVYSDNKIIFHARIATDKNKTFDEYSVITSGIFQLNNIDLTKINGVIMSSVVPPLTSIFEKALKRLCNAKILIVGPGIKTGFNIKIDSPVQLGSDIVCNVAGALAEFKGPLIIADLGTATTIVAVSKNGDVLGGSISPGIRISLNALSGGTAQLPFIDLDSVKNPIGKNTVDCMQSGIIYGTASLVDGMVDRMSEELGEKPVVILTGGMSTMIKKYCKHDIIHKPDLLTNGLYHLYLKNS